MARVVIELLSRAHDRNSFDCGRESQNTFLRQRARKHGDLNYSKTWVAVEEGKVEILGFVALSVGHVAFENLATDLLPNVPKYPMPVLHVGQLATHSKFQGRGIASLLLKFAAEQAIAASASVGCYAIELIADNSGAKAFYVSRGFLPLSQGSDRLYQSVTNLVLASDDEN